MLQWKYKQAYLITNKRIHREKMNIISNWSCEGRIVKRDSENVNIARKGNIHNTWLLYRRTTTLLFSVKGESYNILGPRNTKP